MTRRIAVVLGSLLAVLSLVLATGTLLAAASADGAAEPADPPGSTDTTSGQPTDGSAPTDDPSGEPSEEPSEEPTDDPTQEPTDDPDDGPFRVSDAVFRWGLNDESNNTAFAPGTYNFLSAGKAPDPGSGGQVINNQAKWPKTGATAWKAVDGKVRIEKNTASGTKTATFAGLKTGPNDEPLGTPTSRIFSNHQVVITGGTGEVDPATGRATIRWTGSFTVFYYSGMSFFSLTDPVLTVTPTSATITATATGFASSMDDTSKWQALAPATVTIANLEGVGTRQLGSAKGFEAVATYLKVTHTPADGSQQVRTGDTWGAFPASFLSFMQKAGSAAYWYSSGGSSDAFKVAKPVSISWDAKTALEPEKPPVTPVNPADDPSNDPGVAPPVAPGGAPVAQPAGPALPGQPFAAGAGTPVAGPDGSLASAGQAYQPPVAYALTSSPTPTDRPAGSGAGWEWAAGFLLLLGAVGITVSTPLMNRLKGTR